MQTVSCSRRSSSDGVGGEMASIFSALEPSQRPAVVMDCGTGFTKMGFAGNLQVCGIPVCPSSLTCLLSNLLVW